MRKAAFASLVILAAAVSAEACDDGYITEIPKGMTLYARADSVEALNTTTPQRLKMI